MDSKAEEIARTINEDPSYQATATAVNATTVRIEPFRRGPVRAKPFVSPVQRNLLIHMKDTGGWMHGDPIKVSVQTLHALTKKGLITFKCSSFAEMLPVWQWSAELTEAGKAYFRSP